VPHGGALTCLGPSTAGFYLPATVSVTDRRPAGEHHRLIVVAFSARFLSRHLEAGREALHPLVAGLVEGRRGAGGVSDIRRLTVEEHQGAERVLDPPVSQAGRDLWYEGKLLEWMAAFFFRARGGDELFCDRQKRLARQRADRVIGLLQQRLAEPPSLEEIGREVGCSPFHLSRTFSQEMRMTIPQVLRKLRLERAAELLRSGRFNVTEAALEVGYNSLSHFSAAFHEMFGCCPGLYPLKTPAQQAQRR
jgi:AraC-like DNA-binding protein